MTTNGRYGWKTLVLRVAAGFACILATIGMDAAGTASADDFKVALVLPGSISDGGWNQGAYTGLKTLEGKAGFKVAFTENVAQAEIPQVVRGYADDGFDLMVGHGFQFGSLFAEIGLEYPDQKFFATTFAPGDGVPANVMYLNYRYYDVACSAGVLAAIALKSKMVGFVGGGDNPTTQGMLKAFKAGAEATVEGIKAVGVITGEYNDAAKGREAAAAMVGNGADVLWHTADITGIGAIKGASDLGAKTIGCFADQADLSPDLMITSMVTNNGGLVVDAAEMAKTGAFKGGSEWKPEFDAVWLPKSGDAGYNAKAISADAWSEFEKVWGAVADGKIDTAAFVK